ncbi:Hermansky-Pudlak syndrome 3 [Homalodisca vitripennis]|nr:Hermansky-Pudlak syndrome 3 [Homalodisca vitripennis]
MFLSEGQDYFCYVSECPRLRSSSYSRLAAINVVIATHQEAYLYHFPVENGENVNPGYLISVFSFTSPVMHICLEPYALHALTQTTLESYTIRSTHVIYNAYVFGTNTVFISKKECFEESELPLFEYLKRLM